LLTAARLLGRRKMNDPWTAEPAVTTIAWLNDEFRSTFEGAKVLMTAVSECAARRSASRCHRRITGVHCLHEGQ
jgi:hypothetical protein